MEVYVPDIYKKSIYNINYDLLYSRGIKCLLFDLDNTIVPVTVKTCTKKTKKLFEELKNKGFTVILFSNSSKLRVKNFKDELNVNYVCFAMKPFLKKYKKIMQTYKFSEAEIACIGDQILTDIKGGNKLGLTTILVNPLGTKEKLCTKLSRIYERKVLKKLRDNNLFVKGKYYE